jgi:hypothetical protein
MQVVAVVVFLLRELEELAVLVEAEMAELLRQQHQRLAQ